MRLPKNTVRAVAAATAIIAIGAAAASAHNGLFTAGPKSDGTAVIPIGYTVTPAGSQSALGDLPLTALPFPDGQALLVVNAGQAVQSLQVVSPQGEILQTIQY